MNSVSSDSTTRLSRQLNTKDALFMGLGSMIGAGIFSAIGPALAVAGEGLIISIFIAGFVAYINATSMAQLAAIYPESGGAYVYGKKQLGSLWGFLAGWCFIFGKTASCTAMAMTFANYVFPDFARPIAVLTVIILTLVNSRGIKKTALATKLILSLVVLSLSFFVFTVLASRSIEFTDLSPISLKKGWSSLFQGAGLMFFAFAGYARIATLGEEVVEPKKTIPKAIVLSLAITLVVYLLVALAVLISVKFEGLTLSTAPLVSIVETGKFREFSYIIKVGAGCASVGVLLSLLAGVSRTMFAMAAQGELPRFLNQVHPLTKVPHLAEYTLTILVALVLVTGDLSSAIGFSSFSILIYYAIANAAAWRLDKKQRQWPRWFAAVGFFNCLLIAFSLPQKSIVSGVLLCLLGFIVKRFRSVGDRA